MLIKLVRPAIASLSINLDTSERDCGRLIEAWSYELIHQDRHEVCLRKCRVEHWLTRSVYDAAMNQAEPSSWLTSCLVGPAVQGEMFA